MNDPMLEAIQSFPISDQLKSKATQLVRAAIDAGLRPDRVAPVRGEEDVDVYWWVDNDHISASISEEPDDDGVDLVASFPDPHVGFTVAVFDSAAALLERVRSEVAS